MTGLKSEISWQTDAAGMVIGDGGHDGHLFALSYSDGENLRFLIRRLSGGCVEYELQGVGHLGIVGFRNGAIFGEAFVWKLGDLASKSLDGMYSAVRALFGHDLRAPDAQKEVEKLIRRSPELFFVYAGCAYGGEIAATCERVRIFEMSAAEGAGTTQNLHSRD
jgi:hypothetical protein